MKVYWSRQRGAVITSANASASALGVSGLKEAGIWLPPGMLDIDRLLKYARPRKLTGRELRTLDVQTRRFVKRVGGTYVSKQAAPEFLQWYKSPHRAVWKLNWSDEWIGGTAKVAKAETLAEYGKREPYNWGSAAKGRVKPNDWLLSFLLGDKRVTQFEWMYVDFLVKISIKEKKFYHRDWPFHAVQVGAPSKYPPPPFRISPDFRAAFSRACVRYSFKKLKAANTDKPPIKLLNLIREELEKS
jgi:hypothetical protein